VGPEVTAGPRRRAWLYSPAADAPVISSELPARCRQAVGAVAERADGRNLVEGVLGRTGKAVVVDQPVAYRELPFLLGLEGGRDAKELGPTLCSDGAVLDDEVEILAGDGEDALAVTGEVAPFAGGRASRETGRIVDPHQQHGPHVRPTLGPHRTEPDLGRGLEACTAYGRGPPGPVPRAAPGRGAPRWRAGRVVGSAGGPAARPASRAGRPAAPGRERSRPGRPRTRVAAGGRPPGRAGAVVAAGAVGGAFACVHGGQASGRAAWVRTYGVRPARPCLT
jgi:hypothetical protein